MADTLSNTRKKLTGEIVVSTETYEEIKSRVQTLDQFQELLAEGNTRSITEFVERLLIAAITVDASDLHLEPSKEEVFVRLRIDGILHTAGSLPRQLYEEILSRIKIVSAGIKLNITDQPQDGRFSFILTKNAPIEMRTSTLPAEYGESVVMRILNPQNILQLGELGLSQELQGLFQEEIKKPNGMILVTGPTGSGKTSTLYAFLKELQSPEIKIITIEDPIEYHLEGVSQTQANPEKGYDFASGLQAIVRQDPDVILVGEMRNEETASIALQAALTGHFVLTTLHTNDAAGTFFRLTSLKAKPSLVASAVNLVVAQRLVRKVCQDCVEMVAADANTTEKIKEALHVLIPEKRPTLPKTLRLPQAKGCVACNNTGYKGRIGIFEAIAVDEEIEKLIIANTPISEMKEFAVQRGMIPMYQDGLLKVLQNITTVKEVERESAE